MENEKEIIVEALKLLQQIQTANSDINIEAETGYDEATFIGTDKGFLALSKYLIEFVIASYDYDRKFIIDVDKNFTARKIKGIPCFTSGDLFEVFSDSGDVFPVCAVLTKNEDDKEKIVQAFK